MKSAFAFIAVALMIMVAVVPMVSVFTEENGIDATAANPGVVYAEDMKATYYVYDPVTKTFNNDIGDLVYRAQKLPASLDPAEWVRHDTPGYVWYNVNENSSYYGKMLRYSMTGLSDEEIFTLLNSTTGEYGSGSSWATTTYGFIQVTWTQLANADNVQIKVYKGTEQLVAASLGGYTLERSGTYFAKGVESVGYIIFGANAAGVVDIAGVPHGTYAVELVAEGDIQGGDVVIIDDQVAIAAGVVKNKNGAVITGATVSFSVTTKDGKTTTGTVTTLTSTQATELNTYYAALGPNKNVNYTEGYYYIITEPGAVVKITNVTATGYTFANKTYTTNTITIASGDADKLKVNETIADFIAEEYVVAVTVKSATGDYNIAGATVQATIYLQKNNATETSKYDIATSMTGATVVQPTYISNTTDANGKAYITYQLPAIGTSGATAYLYVKVSGTSNFTFDAKDVTTGTAVEKSIDQQLSGLEAAKAIGVSAAVADQQLKSKEAVSTFTVKDDSAQNPIAGVSANAVWYYQKLDATNKVEVLTTNAPTGTTTAGVVKVLGTSDKNGKISIAYVNPVISDLVGYTVVLYISLNNVAPFTFDIATINTAVGADPIETQVGSKTGCAQVASGAYTGTMESKETTYKVSGNIEAESNVQKKVALTITGSSVDKTAEVTTNGTTAVTYTFVVLKGDAPVIKFACDGYEFDNNEIAMKTIKDADYTTSIVVNMTKEVEPAAEFIDSTVIDSSRSTNTYTVNLDAGSAKVNFTYKIGDKSYATTVKSNGTTATLGIALFDKAVSSIAADISGYATKAFVTKTTDAYKLTETKIIVFSDTTQTVSLDNVVAGANIVAYFDGKEYATLTSDANGLVTAKISGQFTYKYNDLVIGIQSVSGSNMWGADAKFNINGFAPSPAAVYKLTLTVSYVAASSLKNVTDASALDIDIQNVVIISGDSKTFVAPELDGFKFAGWVYNGSASEDKTITVSAGTLTTDGAANLIAVYSAESVSENQKIDSTTLILGIAAVIIALIAVVYAVIQKKN